MEVRGLKQEDVDLIIILGSCYYSLDQMTSHSPKCLVYGLMLQKLFIQFSWDYSDSFKGKIFHKFCI